MSTCRTFTEARLAATEAAIDAYEAAILAFGSSPIQTYKLDTGQSVQSVSRGDIASMKNMLDNLYNRHATLNARLGNCGIGVARPMW